MVWQSGDHDIACSTSLLTVRNRQWTLTEVTVCSVVSLTSRYQQLEDDEAEVYITHVCFINETKLA
jgi:hypothetical protein